VRFIIRREEFLVEADGVDLVAVLHLDFEGAGFLLFDRELGDVVDRALFGDLA
jgi:hypothetical protein